MRPTPSLPICAADGKGACPKVQAGGAFFPLMIGLVNVAFWLKRRLFAEPAVRETAA